MSKAESHLTHKKVRQRIKRERVKKKTVMFGMRQYYGRQPDYRSLLL